MCKKEAASTPLLSPSCKSSSLLLTAFPTWFIRPYWLSSPSLSSHSLPSPSALAPKIPREWAGLFGKRCIFIAVSWLPPPSCCLSCSLISPNWYFAACLPRDASPPCPGLPARPCPAALLALLEEQFVMKQCYQWECSSKVLFAPQDWNFSTCTQTQRRNVPGTAGRNGFSPLGTEKAFVARSRWCSIMWC